MDSLSLKYKGTIDNFEKAAAHLLERDLVVKIVPGNSSSDNVAHVSEAEASTSSTAPGKISKGETGINTRYHKQADLNKLPKKQRDELVDTHKRCSENKD